jgi:hypothetical protein
MHIISKNAKLIYATKIYGGVDPHFLDLDTNWRWLVSFTSQPQSWSGQYGKWKFLTLPGLELQPLGHLVHNQSLYWLHYCGSLTISKTSANIPQWYKRCWIFNFLAPIFVWNGTAICICTDSLHIKIKIFFPIWSWLSYQIGNKSSH